MLIHPTPEQLRQLGLAGMARAFEELATRGAELDHAEWLGLLLDREMADRQDRRLRARLRYARLRHNAAVEEPTSIGMGGRLQAGISGRLRRNTQAGVWEQGKGVDGSPGNLRDPVRDHMRDAGQRETG